MKAWPKTTERRGKSRPQIHLKGEVNGNKLNKLRDGNRGENGKMHIGYYEYILVCSRSSRYRCPAFGRIYIDMERNALK